MPLTRRVQVFIGQEASNALDKLIARTGEKQTALIERLLLEAVGLPRRVNGSKQDSQSDTKLDRSTERIDDVSELAPAGYLADHPLRDEYLEELKKPLPLERKQVLKLWNGRGWKQRRPPDPVNGIEYCYVAAYSVADAVRVINEADPLARMTAHEITKYFHAGLWGIKMDGIKPERGVWITRTDHSKPERLIPKKK